MSVSRWVALLTEEKVQELDKKSFISSSGYAFGGWFYAMQESDGPLFDFGDARDNSSEFFWSFEGDLLEDCLEELLDFLDYCSENYKDKLETRAYLNFINQLCKSQKLRVYTWSE